MRLSRRLPPHGQTNAITQARAALAAAGTPVVDLTASNPTEAGLAYPPALLASLGAAEALAYAPEARGLRVAREAVAADAARRGAAIDPDRVVLSASSSESYSWLFKTFCDPSDAVLVPRPSYPLFEHLAGLESVRMEPYALSYHGRWDVDLAAVERGLAAGARLVVAVSPNNPTGSCLSGREADALTALTAEAGVPLVVDEVFADYLLQPGPEAVTDLAARAAGHRGAAVITLGGLSKSVGLPQVKLGWMVLGGDDAVLEPALAGLGLIADSYLSVSTPVQVAAPALLREGRTVRRQIQERLGTNAAALSRAVARHPVCDLLPVEGGWSAVVRVPATRPEEQLVLDLLAREHTLVHPGYFFDFPREAHLVVSLLPPPAVFSDAVERMLALADTPPSLA